MADLKDLNFLERGGERRGKEKKEKEKEKEKGKEKKKKISGLLACSSPPPCRT